MRVNGLFGWVRHNDSRSVALLLGFVLLMQPLAMIVLFMPLLIVDPAHAPWYAWGGYLDRYVPLISLGAAAAFAAQMWWHIKAVRKDVAFSFVDNDDEPRLCRLVEPLAIAAGVQIPFVGVIDSPAMNAFACGVTARFSVLVFTRGIIDGLDDDELSSVIAHELIHIRNGDTRFMAAANVFMRSMAGLDRVNLWKPRRYRQIAAMLLIPMLFPFYLGIALLSQLCLRIGMASRLMISSAREYIADAEAVRLTQDPAALVSALERINGRSAIAGLPPEQDAMMIDGLATGSLATHPTIAERIKAIVAVTGQMALDARPRRDTRQGIVSRVAGFGRRQLEVGPISDLERVAVHASTPRNGGFQAFFRVGDDLTLFGLRWDLALAMFATFATSMALNHNNLGGFFGQIGHMLDRPDADTQWLIDNARKCQGSLLPRPAKNGSCGFTPEFIAHSKAKGINILPDGRMLTDTQIAMLSPDELRGPAGATDVPDGMFMVPGNGHRSGVGGMGTDLAPSYPLPVHEAWQRLAQGSLSGYLESHQCGILIHAHVQAVPDRSVIWSITSEGVEQVRFTATLTPDGAQSTRVTLDIQDMEKKTKFAESSKPGAATYEAALRPALGAPLRPGFAEAMAAMLEGRRFSTDRVAYPAQISSADSTTDGMCTNQHDRLATGTSFSINDPSGKP